MLTWVLTGECYTDAESAVCVVCPLTANGASPCEVHTAHMPFNVLEVVQYATAVAQFSVPIAQCMNQLLDM